MEFYKTEIVKRNGSFALPPIPEELASTFTVRSVSVTPKGGPIWYRRDGGDATDAESSYRIPTGHYRTVNDAAIIKNLRFYFDAEGADALAITYEGYETGSWLQPRREMSQEEFAQPIRDANSGREQMRAKNCVDAVVATNPGARIPPPQPQQPVLHAGDQQALKKAQDLIRAVTSFTGKPER